MPARSAPPAGLLTGPFAQQGLGARLKGDDMSKEVIAVKDATVYDDSLGFDRKLFAGQPVPPDLVDAYKREVGDVSADETASDDDDGEQVDEFAAHVASTSIKDLLEEVADDDDAAQRVLDAEQARGSEARGTLVEALEKQLADGE